MIDAEPRFKPSWDTRGSTIGTWVRGRPHALSVRLLLVTAALGGALPCLALAAPDPFTSYSQPSNALIMPFDAKDRDTILMVTNVGLTKKPDVSIAGVTTHWVFWGTDGVKLADVSVCLTLNDTVAISPKAVSNIDASNDPFGPVLDLSGKQGFVVVTAYQTDATCGTADLNGSILVDSAIVGSFAISSASGTELNGPAVGLATDATGTFTDLPNFRLSTSGNSAARSLNLQTLNPDILDSSLVVLLGLKEHNGAWPGEVGPLSKKIKADVVIYDSFEIPTTMPNLKFRNALFTSLKPGSHSLIPDTIRVNSYLDARLTNITAGVKPVGCDTFVYAFVGGTAYNTLLSVPGQYSAGDSNSCS